MNSWPGRSWRRRTGRGKVFKMHSYEGPGIFEAAPYLREIGRGKAGSRALSQARARELMTAILAGEVSDLALLRQATRETRVRIGAVQSRLDTESLQWQVRNTNVEANDIVRLLLSTQTPIAADAYSRFRSIGSFILIDPASNDMVAAGMVGAA